MRYAYLKGTGPQGDVIGILHGLQERVRPSTKGHGLAAYLQTTPLDEIEAGLQKGESGFETYCHGRAYFAKRALVACGVPRNDVRGRVILIDRPHLDHYGPHTVIEVRKDGEWKLYDPGKPERDFRVEEVEGVRDYLRPWEFRSMDIEKLRVPRTDGSGTGDPVEFLQGVLTSDIITAARDPYYPWEQKTQTRRQPFTHQVVENDKIELMWDRELIPVLERGENDDFRRLVDRYRMKLVRRTESPKAFV